jgi:hypothetical protein
MTEDDTDQDTIAGLDEGLKFGIPPRSDPADFGDGSGFLQVEEIREASCPESYDGLHQTPPAMNGASAWGAGSSQQPMQSSQQQQQQLQQQPHQQSMMMLGLTAGKLGMRDVPEASADSMTGSNQDARDAEADVSAAQDQNISMQANQGLPTNSNGSNTSTNMAGQGWLKEEPPMIPATAPQTQAEQGKTTKPSRSRRGSQSQLSVNTSQPSAQAAQNNGSSVGLGMGMNAGGMALGGTPSPRHMTQMPAQQMNMMHQQSMVPPQMQSYTPMQQQQIMMYMQQQQQQQAAMAAYSHQQSRDGMMTSAAQQQQSQQQQQQQTQQEAPTKRARVDNSGAMSSQPQQQQQQQSWTMQSASPGPHASTQLSPSNQMSQMASSQMSQMGMSGPMGQMPNTMGPMGMMPQASQAMLPPPAPSLATVNMRMSACQAKVVQALQRLASLVANIRRLCPPDVAVQLQQLVPHMSLEAAQQSLLSAQAELTAVARSGGVQRPDMAGLGAQSPVPQAAGSSPNGYMQYMQGGVTRTGSGSAQQQQQQQQRQSGMHMMSGTPTTMGMSPSAQAQGSYPYGMQGMHSGMQGMPGVMQAGLSGNMMPGMPGGVVGNMQPSMPGNGNMMGSMPGMHANMQTGMMRSSPIPQVPPQQQQQQPQQMSQQQQQQQMMQQNMMPSMASGYGSVTFDQDQDEASSTPGMNSSAPAPTPRAFNPDLPHPRSHCLVRPFKMGKERTGQEGGTGNEQYCPNCLCYVCDVKASECQVRCCSFLFCLYIFIWIYAEISGPPKELEHVHWPCL